MTGPDLVVDAVRICARGPGGWTDLARRSRCTGCGWRGPLWDGDQPPLADAMHECGRDLSWE